MIFFKKFFENLIYLFSNFASFWWKDTFFFWKETFEKTIFRLEKFFAVKVNIHYIFQPLYQEYNIFGYLFGFPLRSLRILTGSIVYLFIFLFFLTTYIFWSLLPFLILYKGLKEFK